MDNSTTTAVPNPTTIPSDPISANAILLPTFAILISLLLITPFRLLLRVHNISATALTITTWISLLFITLNSLIWPTDTSLSRFSGHILCDIQVALRGCLYTCMASTTCCITKFLASAVDTDRACFHETRAMKRRRLLSDCLFCFLVPVMQVALHYLVQINRYSVLTIYGCVDTTDQSWPSVLIFHIWPPIFACLNFYFAVLVIHRLRVHRNNFSSTLSSSSSGLSPRRFLKLFTMSLTLLLIYFPILIYYLYLNIDWPFHAYSFSELHDPYYWNMIIFLRTADAASGMQYDAWCWCALGFLIWVWWGWNDEGWDMWRKAGCTIGLGRVWPRLRMSAQERRTEKLERSRAASASGSGNWTSKVDLVGRAVNYFENREVARKGSVGTATTFDEDSQIHSHQANTNPGHTSLSQAATLLSQHEKSFSSTSSHTATPDHDTITPLPPRSEPSLQHPLPSYSTSYPSSGYAPSAFNFGSFSAFRTHSNPISLGGFFTKSSSAASSSCDVEKGASGSIDNQVRTKISSPASPVGSSHLNTAAAGLGDEYQTQGTQTSPGLMQTREFASVEGESGLRDLMVEEGLDDGEGVEDLKPGTRAYRERERREMLAEKKAERKEKREREERELREGGLRIERGWGVDVHIEESM